PDRRAASAKPHFSAVARSSAARALVRSRSPRSIASFPSATSRGSCAAMGRPHPEVEFTRFSRGSPGRFATSGLEPSWRRAELARFDAVLLELSPERRLRDAEDRRGLLLVRAARLQHGEDVTPLDLGERQELGIAVRVAARARTGVARALRDAGQEQV